VWFAAEHPRGTARKDGVVRNPPRLLGPSFVLLTVMLGACGATTTPSAAVLPPPVPPSALAGVAKAELAGSPPKTFIALDDQVGAGNQPVALYDASTGKVIAKVLGGSLAGMNVVSLALDTSGSLWVTFDRGPAYANDSLGGDPQPNSCANDVVRVNLTTGRSVTVLSTGDNELVEGAWPSPDGRFYVYMSSGCANSYFNGHLTVVENATGRSWTIGAALPRCHSLSAPAWTPDSRSLIVTYGAATPIGDTPLGACPQWRSAQLVVVNALDAQGGLSGTATSADSSCVFSSATALGSGVVGLEHCNASSADSDGQYIDGPARLVIFDAQMHAQTRIPLGECNDGSELAADPTGTAILVSAYLYCPGATQPETKLWSYTRAGLALLTQVPGDGDPLTDITW
jgi:hypothetical protein